jgi:hypothetical protein
MHLLSQRQCTTLHRARRDCRVRAPTATAASPAAAAQADGPSTSGRVLEYAPTPESPSLFVDPRMPAVDPWVRPTPETYTPPSVRDSGTLRPAAEWYPAWMQYRQREDNYVFWQDKFSRCSLDIPGMRQQSLEEQSHSLKQAQLRCRDKVRHPWGGM